MEVEFNGIIGLILAVVLGLLGYGLHIKKPRFLQRRLTLGNGNGMNSTVDASDIEDIVRGVLDQHCPRIQEEVMRTSNENTRQIMADSVIAFRELMVEWKGRVDARLEGTAFADNELKTDIRELRADISQLRKEIAKR